MSILEFLDARISEDEAATPSGETWRAKWHTVDCGVGLGYWANGDCVCDGPARVLAECSAKRAILANVPRNSDLYDAHAYTSAHTVYALAAVYADHPDYLPEWKL